MKRVFVILLTVLLLPVFSPGASAEIIVEQDWIDDALVQFIESNNHLSSTVGGSPSVEPEYYNTNNASLSFYISDKGKATVTYTVALKDNGVSSATAVVYIEKHLVGPFWQRLNVKWTDSFYERYHVDSVVYRLNDEGTYRAVLQVKAGSDDVKLTAEFEYKKGYLHGDVNKDSRITAADARLVLRYSARLEGDSVDIRKRGDMNGDGKVNANDARLLLRISASL